MSDDVTAIRLLGIVRDIGFVSFGKYGQYLVTAVTVPLAARLLGTEGLGLLAIGMSAYFIGSLLVDLGIAQFLSAMLPKADVNQLRGNYLAIRAGILAVLAAALGVGLAVDVGPAATMILLGLAAGGLFAMTEDWVLIGQGRFFASMAYQAVGRVVYLVLLIVLLPRYPSAVVALLCLLVSALPMIALTWRDTIRRFGRPKRPRELLPTLRMGAPVLTSRLLIASYGQGSGVVYASVLDAASLGLFSAGDRIVRALQSLLDPIGFALLPRMARIADDDRFWRRATLALLSTVGVATAVTAVLWAAAPLLIAVVFGDQFTESVALLRVEALILPATAVTSFVITAVLTVRRDTTGVLVGGIIGTSLAAGWLVVAAMTHSVWTLVWGTVCSEVGVAAWYAYRMRRLVLRERRTARARASAAVVPSEERSPL
ncbi:lipopolysaccharide biosynthesis protein [Blastococcus sp. VKM Ac-2987]|uniref:lipopolysaccharide biosynthesis protein n=1 Tax=Blastococcus sp. VKM Ac-2987 TaxID=3004141 RepID=UPI0022AB7FD9|nr:oligosaccharide flippase family protein [Blastococcus sp. VKM Ac-2987]MCZ2858501.1 oligosaccharide flippase family protein [Blastococcus sp. VKM Ac-2987]